jgi:hypothetical protein
MMRLMLGLFCFAHQFTLKYELTKKKLFPAFHGSGTIAKRRQPASRLLHLDVKNDKMWRKRG